MQHVDLPEPPECPPWCRESHDFPWDVHLGATERVCRRVVETVADGEIVMQRYASIEDGRVCVEAPTIKLHVPDAMHSWDAATVADTLARVVDLLREPALVG